MARTRAPKRAAAPSATGGQDRTLYTHNLWLNYLKPVSIGLVVSPNALRAAQVELNPQAAEAQRLLDSLAATVADPDAADNNGEPAAPRHLLRDARAFLTEFLGWKPELLEWYRPGERVQMTARGGPSEDGRRDTPAALRSELAQFDDEALEPTFAYRWPSPPEPDRPYCLLGLEVPDGVDLDRADVGPDTSWHESPQRKFERLLYEARIPLGLIVAPGAVRVVYRPEAEQSGYITFPLEALLAPAGKLAATAMRSLLNHDRLHRLPSRQRLHAILAESRKYQNEVSTQLAQQVLAALFDLLRGFEAADAEAHGTLLRGLRDDPARTHEIYEGLLTVLMRLVFLLYAEERELLPVDSPLFARNYTLAGLFAKLAEDEARHPDTMEQRYGAWASLVALFRVAHDGLEFTDPFDGRLRKVPPRQGGLFDPSRFPFLEGRADADPTADGPRALPKVSDGIVLSVLRNLLYLNEERLSYRTLEVEQIGSVYEAIMGFRVETARGRSVAIRPEKAGGAPVTISLDELLATPAGKRGKWFKDQTDRKLAAAAASAVKDATNLDGLFAALGRLIDTRLTPSPVPDGSLVVQPNAERRRSGSHYTPRALTQPIVAKALEPVLARLGPEPMPDAILALKVCDPAMGSGAFLVESMRQLAGHLLDAWKRHGTPRIPKDETPLLHACRLIAQRCLYGVDKNPMAVDLAKLSLWLATLARDHAFTFLDHNLRHGDSLVGLSVAQLEACHWAPDAQQGFVTPSIRRRLAVVIDRREAIRAAGDLVSYEKLSDIRREAEEPLEFLRFLGDAVVGTFFEGGSATERERRRKDLAQTIRDYLNESIDLPTRLVLRREIEAPAQALRRLEPPVETFHWEVEFPEVFLEGLPDGSLRRRADGGFDAIVGNPPFAGRNTLVEANGPIYAEWLRVVHTESHGNADVVAHFFRRAFGLIQPGGTFGLIATNTIGQGDTRSTGLRWIRTHGGAIYAARKRYRWPGAAAVIVSVVHVAKGEVSGSSSLNGQSVSRITAYLFQAGGDQDPQRLRANESKSFQGSNIVGVGFTFDDTDNKGKANPISRVRAAQLAQTGERPVSMEELIERDPRNRERIFPYIGGREVNDSPSHAFHRYVINFEQMSLENASRWPDLLSIVREKVKPERDRLRADTGPGAHGKKWWWQFQHPRQPLYAAIAPLDRTLVISQVTSHCQFALLPTRMVFSHALNVFSLNTIGAFSVLQSRPHEFWARFLGSSMKDDLRYTPSDCFETFPFPDGWETDAALEAAGREYYEFRAELMRASNLGLTKTYNRFHDPRERSPEITRLRELHAAMDRAVLAAYRWTDLDTTCGFDVDYCESAPADDASPDTVERVETGRFFFETAADAQAFAAELADGGKKLPWRYRWRPEARDDLLARLLLLNEQRAAAERQAGLGPLADRPEEDVPDEEGDDDGDDEDA